MKFLIAAALLLASGVCRAEMPVEVQTTGDDPVGKQLAYWVKEGIRSSSSMKIEFDDSKVRLQVSMVTLEQTPSSPGLSTVYSVVLTWQNPDQPFPFFLNQYTGYCGASRVQSCADGIVADVSEASDSIIKLLTAAASKR